MNGIIKNKIILSVGFLISTAALDAVDVSNPIYLYKGDFVDTYTVSSPGYYLVTEDVNFSAASTALVITTSHVTVDFNTHAIYNTGSGVNGIDITENLTNITIKDVTLTNFTQNGINIGTDDGISTNIRLENITCSNCGDNGLEMGRHSDVDIVNCSFINNTNYGAYMSVSDYEYSEKSRFSNCHFDDNSSGCIVENSIYITFDSCTFDRNELTVSGTVYGLQLYHVENALVTNCSAIGNNQALSTGNVIGFDLNNSDNCRLDNCTAMGNNYDYLNDDGYEAVGILIRGDSDPDLNYSKRNIITNCKTSDNNSSEVVADGIGIKIETDSFKNTIRNCTSEANGGYGIYNGGSNSIITGCICGNNPTANYSGATTTTINQLGDNDVPSLSDYTNIDLV